MVDPRAYPGVLGALERQLGSELAVSPLLSPDRDLLFYDLRPLLAALRSRYSNAQLSALRTAVLSPLAYILVLIALSFSAVSAVAPAREVSVLAGVLLGRRLLGEGGLARRLTAAAAIAAGIICIAVG